MYQVPAKLIDDVRCGSIEDILKRQPKRIFSYWYEIGTLDRNVNAFKSIIGRDRDDHYCYDFVPAFVDYLIEKRIDFTTLIVDTIAINALYEDFSIDTFNDRYHLIAPKLNISEEEGLLIEMTF